MKLSRLIAVLALAATILFVFVDQAPDPGFRAGHRGWVSAHTLAIIEHATAANGFVGYTLALKAPSSRALYYFDRYPVFFSAGMHALLHSVRMSLARQVYVARQAMNFLYALTLLAGVAVLVELGMSLEAAIAASAMAGLGYYMVEYRDMVHFDQPALFGFMLLLWAIAGWYRGRGDRRVYVVTAVAVLSGRGYASFAVLGVWWLLESFDALRSLGSDGWRAFATRIVLGAPTRACLLSIAIAVACLSYNVTVEAHARGVPITEVGILASAGRRLSLNEDFNEKKAKHLTWGTFFEGQGDAYARGLLPWRRVNPMNHHETAVRTVAAIVALAALAFAASRPSPLRIPYLLLCLAGPVWLTAMRDLTAFHHYTTMYLFPLSLAAFAAFLHLLPSRGHVVAAVLACALLAVGTEGKNHFLLRKGGNAAKDTKDMQRVSAVLRPGDAVGTIPGFRSLFHGAPFALGFYLSEHDILIAGEADLILTRSKTLEGKNLTPDNKKIFLYRPTEPRLVHSGMGLLKKKKYHGHKPATVRVKPVRPERRVKKAAPPKPARQPKHPKEHQAARPPLLHPAGEDVGAS